LGPTAHALSKAMMKPQPTLLRTNGGKPFIAYALADVLPVGGGYFFPM